MFVRTKFLVASQYEAFAKLEHDSKSMFVYNRYGLFYLRQALATRPLHIGSEPITMDLMAWSVPKKSPLTPSLNWMSV